MSNHQKGLFITLEKQLLLFIFFSSIHWLSVAQSEEAPRVINFTKEEYKAYNQNWAICQSTDGNIFTANSRGLLVFNGSKWRNFPLPNQQIIRSIAIGKNGQIFTGAFSEFGYWEQTNEGNFVYHSLTHLIQDNIIKKEEIWHILPLADAVIFQSFSAIYLYDYKEIRPLKPSGNIRFAQEINGRLLLPIIHQGLFELRNNNGFSLLPGTELLADMTVVFILPYDDTQLLIGTADHGIYLYDKMTLSPWNSNLQDILTTNQLNKGIRLSNGNFALGTILDGVYIVDRSGRNLYHLNQQNGLQNNTVLSFLEDQAKNLWVGLDKGIDLIEISSPLNFFKDKNGSIGSVYSATIYQQNLLIGSNQGLFIKPWQSSPLEKFSLIRGSQGQVWEIKEFDQQLLVGHNDGTFLTDGNQIESISDISGGWVTLRHPQKPEVLIQGTYAGLIALTKNSQGKWHFSHKIQGLSFAEPIKEMLFDKDGNLWAVNPYRGLYRIQLDDSLRNIISLYSFTVADGLPSEYKIDIDYIENQVIIRSKNEFFTFDPDVHKLISLTNFNGYELPEGTYRIKAGYGSDWFQIFQNQIIYHTEGKKLFFNLPLAPDYEGVTPIGNNTYLFGLDDGYAIFDPKNKHYKLDDAPLPAIRIHLIETFDKNASQYHARNTSNLQLAAKENNIRFEFSQPVYTLTPRYSFQLQGFENEWSEWQTTPEKEYNRLPAGSYTFLVKSNLSSDIAAFSFSISVPWYRSWWASTLYIIILGLSIWLVERWNQHRLEKQRLHLEQDKEKHLEEERIKTANEKLQLDLINKSKELANSTMTLVKKNELLLSIKEEIRKIKASADGHLSGKHHQRLLHLIDTNISSEEDWQLFETNFNQVHEQFLKRLKKEFPDLTPGDLKLAAYLKMSLNSKEIAPLLNISLRSVENKRYRLRKKLNLAEDDNLTEFMLKY